MKIAVLSDIHGDLNNLHNFSELLKSVDLTIVSGDLTSRGDFEELNVVVSSLKEYSKKLYAIPGNMDGMQSIEVLETFAVSLHNEVNIIKNIGFTGFGGSTKTPFSTPFEIDEFDIVEKLNENFDKLLTQKPDKTVVVCHNPPYNTAVDKVLLGRHVGSREIRKFIEKKQPSVFLSGHIHEAVGIDKIGKTILLNPGPFRRGIIGLINIPENGEIEAELKKGV